MMLEELDIASWDAPISKQLQQRAIESLEHGKVLIMPALPFALKKEEQVFLSPHHVDPKRKNISFDPKLENVGGSLCTGNDLETLKGLLKRYALMSSHFLKLLFPHYVETLTLAKTSFRPTEISGRKSSVRKDDTRLHIDAFPSNPTKGKRILRIFTNINPDGKPRVWKVGEPFEEVAKKFACQISSPIPGSAQLLKLLKITKDTRTSYDHYMLHMHNRMKEDNDYQRSVNQAEIQFPSGCTWIVFTDQVSHAALSGQHVLEQTFSLPTLGLQQVSTAPLKVLERCLNRSLI